MDAVKLICGVRVLPEDDWSFYAGKRCLVTGAAGSIGKRVFRLLMDSRANVTGIDFSEWDVVVARQEGLPVKLSDCRFVSLDYDYVFHCAAYKHVVLAEEDPEIYAQQNFYMVKQMFDRTRAKVIFCSTDKAAGTSAMGKTKKLSEQYFEQWCQAGHRAVSLRLVNCVGSRGSVVHRWKKEIKDRRLPKVGPFEVKRYWMQEVDAAEGLLRAGVLASGTYGIWGMPEVSLGDLWEAFCEVNFWNPEDKIDLPLSPGEVMEERLVSERESVKEVGEPWLRRIESR